MDAALPSSPNTHREESMPSILIVEDETATAWAIAESLKDDGHETSTVESAEDALVQLRDQGPHLVITDLRLPGMSGVTLARRIRTGRHPLPVIVVTAFGSAEALAELEGIGVHAVFSKPFRVEQLRRSVRDALGINGPPEDPRPVRSGRGGAP
jgi:two-component system response regulator (stage 0 sporulation protein F)